MANQPTLKVNQHISAKPAAVLAALLSFISLIICLPLSADQLPKDNEIAFLVATDQLENTAFQQAVILLTHYSEKGATGLTINRPSTIPLKKIFPHTQQFRQRKDSLYLGGPVSTNAIFVLLRTNEPTSKMHHIANNIYFSTARNALSTPINDISRTYAGYSGWAPGQLQNEIKRGDWIIVHTDPNIIFEKDPQILWQRLSKRWSGQWL